MTEAMDHYRQGNLRQAAAAVANELRRQPGNAGKRAFYAELLCLLGEFEKADSQLATLQTLAPDALVTVGTWRQLLQAAQARVDVHAAGRTPELLGEADNRTRVRLDMLIAIREQDWPGAARQALLLEESRPIRPLWVNGKAVDDLRDLDDVDAGLLEVLASNGKYFWVCTTQVESLALHRPERPLDLLWRKAELTLLDGTHGQVFIPMIYATPTDNEQALLGRATQWQDRAGLVRGIGLRTWLIGDEAMPLSRIDNVECTADIRRGQTRTAQV